MKKVLILFVLVFITMACKKDKLVDEKEIYIINNLGQTIYYGAFNQSFYQELSSGFYYVVILGKNGLNIKKKIVVL